MAESTNAEYRKVIRRYFGEALLCLLMLNVLFLAGFVISVIARPWTNWNLIIPFMMLLSPLLWLRTFLFRASVYRDIKANGYRNKTVCIQEITYDTPHNMYRCSGAIPGRKKYKLTTKENEIYYFDSEKDITEFISFPNSTAELVSTAETKIIVSFRTTQKHRTKQQIDR